jgi:hypothetical protein
MILTPPPPSLTPEQFKRAMSEGKRTLAEIDPELWKWYQSGNIVLMFGGIAIALGIIVLIIMIGLIFQSR